MVSHSLTQSFAVITYSAAAVLLAATCLDADEKQPAPAPADTTAIREDIEQIFELEQATTSEKKRVAAEKMISTAGDTNNDPVTRFALLNMARQTAGEAADLSLAFKAIDALAVNYTFDVDRVKYDSLTTALSAAKDDATRRAIIAPAVQFIDDLLSAGEGEKANAVLQPLLSMARRAASKEEMAVLVDRRDRAEFVASAQKKAKVAIETLKSNPDDPAANNVAGRFALFVRKDLEQAWPLLAKGDDQTSVALANLELAPPQQADAQVKLGDAWWDFAATCKLDPEKEFALARAGHWYETAVPELGGLSKIKVNDRLKTIESEIGDSTVAFGKSGQPLPQAKPTSFAEDFGKPVADATKGVGEAAYKSDVAATAAVADGYLQLHGSGGGSDQQLIFTAKQMFGETRLPDKFVCDVKLANKGTRTDGFHVAVAIGNIKGLVHPGFPGGSFRVERNSDHKDLLTNRSMGFTPASGTWHAMSIAVTRAKTETLLEYTFINGDSGEKFYNRAVISNVDCEPFDHIALIRCGGPGGSVFFDDLSVKIVK